MYKVVLIFREICKVAMLTVVWLLPVYLFKISGQCGMLWFFVLSVFLSAGIFSHFETLERVDRFAEIKKNELNSTDYGEERL